MNKEHVTRLLTAIGDPVRLEIMFLLSACDRLNVGDITGNFRLSQPAISHHLRVLREAGVLKNEKVGQEVFYQLDCAEVVNQLRCIADAIETCHDAPNIEV